MNHAGIDVGKETLHLAIRGTEDTHEYKNTPVGRAALLRRLKSAAPVRVVVEPTAQYHLAISKELASSEFADVMLANPRATANFAKALDQRGKSDIRDCKLLADFAALMDFKVWQAPSPAVETLRAVMRRRHQLVVTRTQEKVRLREARSVHASAHLVDDIQSHIDFLNVRIKELEKRALALAEGDQLLGRWIAMLTSIPGIGQVLALVLTAELVHLPTDITGRQLVAFAGLDPRENQSGKRDGVRRISRRGNKRVRTALYIAASVASQHSPHVKAWKAERVERGKNAKLVNVAVARRLLHVIATLLGNDGRWDGSRFNPKMAAENA